MCIYIHIYECICIKYVCAFIILKMNEPLYMGMYECTYEHTYHYLLSKVIFKYERKLVGTSVRVYVSTYVCMSIIVYGKLYQCRTVGFEFCQNHFRLYFNF